VRCVKLLSRPQPFSLCIWGSDAPKRYEPRRCVFAAASVLVAPQIFERIVGRRIGLPQASIGVQRLVRSISPVKFEELDPARRGCDGLQS
jgi:hypothetical protein